ncbi:TPA: hypothetical protein L4V39_001829 [Pseudomonas aeruginosa]|nr:hypothetical protein [Pseudomonas aeruginosa]
MSTNHQCNAVIDAIGEIIGKNADWLDGRLFQKLAMIAARANYEDEELDDYGTFDDLQKSAALLGQAMNLWPKAKQ